MILQTLDNIVSQIDTGLKAATLIEISKEEEINAPSLARKFGQYKFYENINGDLRKKIESIKKALDDFSEYGIVKKFDTGVKQFQAPQHTYILLDPNSNYQIKTMLDIAKLSIKFSHNSRYPTHFFWDIKGGSFSTDTKHIRQGLQLLGFYNCNISEALQFVNSNSPTLPTIKTSEELKKLWNLDESSKGYITKFANTGLIQKSNGLRAENKADHLPERYDSIGRRQIGNSRLYEISQIGKQFLEEVFIPSLASMLNISHPKIKICNQEFSQEALRLKYSKSAVQNHYKSIINQFNNN